MNFSNNILNPINIKINDKAYSIIGNLFTIGAINKYIDLNPKTEKILDDKIINKL